MSPLPLPSRVTVRCAATFNDDYEKAPMQRLCKNQQRKQFKDKTAPIAWEPAGSDPPTTRRSPKRIYRAVPLSNSSTVCAAIGLLK
jgi:hypothetical protein